jgi:hypothetical protein
MVHGSGFRIEVKHQMPTQETFCIRERERVGEEKDRKIPRESRERQA